MYEMGLTEAQVKALRSQAESLAKECDEEFVAFFEKNPELLQCEEFQDLAQQAAESYDRLQAAEKKANKERRQKIAGIFSAKGFADASVAIEMELDGQDGGTLAWIAMILCRDIPAAGLYGWAKWHAYQHANRAKDLARVKARETTIQLFSRFIREIQTAQQCLSELNAVPKGVQPKKVSYARKAYERAAGIVFRGWALSVIEEMIEESDNPVSESLREDPELAADVAVAPERRRALRLIESLKEMVRQPLEEAEQRIAERRQKAKEKETARRERQLARAAQCLAQKGNNPQVEKGKKKLGKRAVNDPKYRGKWAKELSTIPNTAASGN